MARILLSIGSNIKPEYNFKRCAKALATHLDNPIWSPVYRSAAVGMEGDDFLNAVVLAQTDQSIHATTQLLKNIEREHGRVRTSDKFSSRTLDLDLLLYDDDVINTPDINIPRAEIINTAHVLIPLVDLVPDDIHPVLNKTYQALLSDLERSEPGLKQNLAEVILKL